MSLFSKKDNSKKALVVVTGCSSGIGRCLALDLANKGYVVLATIRRKEDAQSLKDAHEERSKNSLDNNNLIPVLVDVTIKEDLNKLYEIVSELLKNGQLELKGVISNAGLASFSIFEIIDLENTEMHFDINYFGAVQVALRLLEFLKKSKGRIIFIGSIASSSILKHLHAYCATKIALRSTAQILKAELEEYGVKVSIVEPGYIDTVIFKKADDIYKKIKEKEGMNASEIYSAGFTSNGESIKMNKELEPNKKDLFYYKRSIEFSKTQFYFFTKFAISPKHVVYHCQYILNAPFVSSCYRVGLDSYLVKLMELFPDFIQEKFRLLT